MSESDVLRKKAELLIAGTIVLGPGVSLPFPLSRSSAGPEVGTRNILLGFGGTRVKLKVSRDTSSSPFTLTRTAISDLFPAGEYRIEKNNSVFLDPVIPIRTPIHAPDQAFINIDARCRYDCLFCTSRNLKNYRRPSNDEWISLIRRNANADTIRSVAITSGVPTSINENLDDFETIIRGIADLGLPIGVEPYVTTREQLERLHDAGSSELKLNIQSWDPTIYRMVCPDSDLDLGDIRTLLKHGVEIFGPNRVQSNMIIGFGENDETILDGVRTLASLGVAVSLRRLHLNDNNRIRLERVMDLEAITVPRYLKLRTEQERIFSEEGIDPTLFRTMCFPCMGCDLEPW